MIAVGFVILLTAQPQTIPWNQGTLAEGDLRGDELLVRGEPGQNRHLLTLVDPSLPAHRFVLKTTVSGRVGGAAILEMVLLRNPEDKVAERFVRTVDTGGPMAKLSGEFEGRDVELPCVSDPADPPKVIRVSMRFEGPGEVRLQPFRIEPWQRFSLTWMAAGGAAMFLGVVLGAVAGVSAFLAAVPALRPIAYRVSRFLAVFGVAMILAAFVLFITGSPFGIWMTIGVGGAVCLLGFGAATPLIKRGMDESNRLGADSRAAGTV